jgi:parallel beta-helix repeat protein
MTKIQILRWICLLGIFLALIVMAKTGAAQNIYVSPAESIHAAVDRASPGDTIFIKPGKYNESIQLYQGNLTIVSESKNPEDTIVSSDSKEKSVFEVTASNVTISGISIIYSNCAIYLKDAQNCIIKGNNITNNEIGICLSRSENNTLSTNRIYSNAKYGIKLLSSQDNIIHENYFNNTNNALNDEFDSWNYTSGNYWNDYTGKDKNNDGIGDTPYVIDLQTGGVDLSPLINSVPEPPLLPRAIFTSNVTAGYAPLTVEFTDLSENLNELSWNVGDLEISNSSMALHTFRDEGSYTVTLNVSNENGSDSKVVTIDVFKAPDPSIPVFPEAKFGANLTSGSAPLTVQFIDFSENSDFLTWSFGDGKESGCPTPAHTFFCPGNYTVTLRAMNDNGTALTCTVITVMEPSFSMLPEAKFRASTVKGPAPLRVEFLDLSENATDVVWNFGDGNSSTAKSPVHIYTTPGNYTLSLKVRNEIGADSKEIINLIQVEPLNNTNMTGNDPQSSTYTDNDSPYYSSGNEFSEREVEYSENKSDYSENYYITDTSNSSKFSASDISGRSKGIIGVINNEIKTAEKKASSVTNKTAVMELKPSIRYEVLKNIRDIRKFTGSSESKTFMGNILSIILLVEILGIFLIVNMIKKGRKRNKDKKNK